MRSMRSRSKDGASVDETATEISESVKGSTDGSGKGFFSNWFAQPSETGETRDDDASSDFSSSYDTGDDDNMRSQTESFETDDYDSVDDDDSLLEFDKDMRTRHGQACKYMRSGKFAKALKKFEAILAAILERFGENHHRVGAALHNVGIANLRAGKLDDAMDAIEEAVRIRKLTLGPDDPKVADSLVELGIVLLSLKEYADSLEVFMEALEMREAEADDIVLPEQIKESSLKIAKVLNNIGCVNFENSKFSSALEAFADAIKMQKKALGDVSPFSFNNPATKPGFLTMASTMCNKGYIDLEQENFKAAVGTFTESLKIQKLLLGADNKLVLSTLDNLGYAQTLNGSTDKGLATYKELLSNQEKSYGESQSDCARTMRSIIHLQLKNQDYENALKMLCSLEDIQVEIAGDKSSKELAETRKLMGQVNYQVLKYPTTAGCGIFTCSVGETDEDMDLSNWTPDKPKNGSKMSGHRVTCA
mmetsp:Transcript_11277/g.16574  ORF Transcript_11277/g.16574 Transcript_11277/m.16574 type:complete len:477 (-) Transcript_11277:56-1486(-)